MDTSEDLSPAVDRLDDGGAIGAGKVRARKPAKDADGTLGRVGGVAEAAAGDDGRVEVADGEARPAKYKPDDSVYLRLARAQSDVKKITQDADVKGKTKDGGTFSYKGVSAAQIITNAKSVLLANGVLFLPVPRKDGVHVVGNKTALWVEGHFISFDDADDRFVTGAWGAGTDQADKDYAKAYTNAQKLILSKTLGMSTLEDESEEATLHEPEHKPKAVKNAEALSDAAIKSWADAYKSAIDGCKTLKQLKQIRAENAPMMNNPGVPAVTKDYFIDKITALEGTLE